MALENHMHRAIELARQGMIAGDGGPFGAVIIYAGSIVGEGWNQVIRNQDPTAHGEVMAIRDACSRLQTVALDDCEIVTTGEPCPMCFGAIHWARLRKIHFGFSITDAEGAGFDDQRFFDEFSKLPAEREIPAFPLLSDAARQVLAEYVNLPNRRPY